MVPSSFWIPQLLESEREVVMGLGQGRLDLNSRLVLPSSCFPLLGCEQTVPLIHGSHRFGYGTRRRLESLPVLVMPVRPMQPSPVDESNITIVGGPSVRFQNV